MKSFLLLFVGLPARPAADDAQSVAYNAQWSDYMGGLARDGRLKAGAPFEPSGRVVTGAEVSDLELKEIDIGGYVLIEADSLEAAVDVAKRAPHAALGGTTIVRPCLTPG
ncbi:MAG: YciI family protein [Solirubrobacteraceae bacterium]